MGLPFDLLNSKVVEKTERFSSFTHLCDGPLFTSLETSTILVVHTSCWLFFQAIIVSTVIHFSPQCPSPLVISFST